VAKIHRRKRCNDWRLKVGISATLMEIKAGHKRYGMSCFLFKLLIINPI
jgi:hypothetical protein